MIVRDTNLGRLMAGSQLGASKKFFSWCLSACCCESFNTAQSIQTSLVQSGCHNDPRGHDCVSRLVSLQPRHVVASDIFVAFENAEGAELVEL